MERVNDAIRRCAIYTRKSSEEGLEQDFNSLHAQREACRAFIKSQQSAHQASDESLRRSRNLNRCRRESSAYIAGWLKKLRDDRKLLIHAAAQAQHSADYILERRESCT